MKIIHVIQEEFKNKGYVITSDGPYGVKIELPPEVDFNEAYDDIFTALVLIKPKFGIIPALKVTVTQFKYRSFSID